MDSIAHWIQQEHVLEVAYLYIYAEERAIKNMCMLYVEEDELGSRKKEKRANNTTKMNENGFVEALRNSLKDGKFLAGPKTERGLV